MLATLKTFWFLSAFIKTFPSQYFLIFRYFLSTPRFFYFIRLKMDISLYFSINFFNLFYFLKKTLRIKRQNVVKNMIFDFGYFKLHFKRKQWRWYCINMREHFTTKFKEVILKKLNEIFFFNFQKSRQINVSKSFRVLNAL